MKNTIKLTAVLLLVVILALGSVSCSEGVDATGLWEKATYTSDTTLGSGNNTVKVEIVAGEKSVTLTINTDKATIGEALYEHGLINDPSFFNTCNGIVADYDKDGAYWSVYMDGTMMPFGVGDPKAVTTGTTAYRIVYTK